MNEPTAAEMQREHQQVRDYVREAIKNIDHPEALRAFQSVVAVLRMVAGSLWDGTQGMDLQRQYQGRIDSTVIANVGLAIEEHVKDHRR